MHERRKKAINKAGDGTKARTSNSIFCSEASPTKEAIERLVGRILSADSSALFGQAPARSQRVTSPPSALASTSFFCNNRNHLIAQYEAILMQKMRVVFSGGVSSDHLK